MQSDYLKNYAYIVILCLFLISILNLTGCAHSKSVEFREKIQRMSDTELLDYYRGVNARIKDIGNDMRRDEQLYDTQHPNHYIYPTPFAIGGEGYHLHQKRKEILKELHRRNIHP